MAFGGADRVTHDDVNRAIRDVIENRVRPLELLVQSFGTRNCRASPAREERNGQACGQS
jgi:hypothetical protein